MAALSDAQIAAAARAAGFSGESVAIAVAVALAESSGNPRARNAVPPDNSYGLWQINMLGSMGPARRQQFGLSSNEQLYDPTTNARAAYAISSQGRNWKPWSTYTGQTYRMYMNRGQAAAGNPAGSVPGAGQVSTGTGGSIIQTNWSPGSSGAVQVELDGRDFLEGLLGSGGMGWMLPDEDGGGGVLGVGSSIIRLLMQWTTALIKSAAWLGDSDNWVRIAQVIAGGGLVIAGVGLIARPAVNSGAAKVITNVLPIGKAGKAASAVQAAGKAA